MDQTLSQELAPTLEGGRCLSRCSYQHKESSGNQGLEHKMVKNLEIGVARYEVARWLTGFDLPSAPPLSLGTG
jgi:hypothetical protein